MTFICHLQLLDEELKMNKCSSFELIEQYYLEKISLQVRLSSPSWSLTQAEIRQEEYRSDTATFVLLLFLFVFSPPVEYCRLTNV